MAGKSGCHFLLKKSAGFFFLWILETTLSRHKFPIKRSRQKREVAPTRTGSMNIKDELCHRIGARQLGRAGWASLNKCQVHQLIGTTRSILLIILSITVN